MFSLSELLSQWTLEITPICQLKCVDCQLWDSQRKERVGLLASLEDGSFFHQFPNKKLINIVGGEPFEHSQLVKVLRAINQQGIKIRLWTNGNVMREFWYSVLPYLDCVMFYLPTIDQEGYQTTTGFGDWNDFHDAVSLLFEHKKLFGFHVPVTATSVSELPDLFDFSRQYGALFYLHYFYNEPFYGQQKSYIDRFYRVKNAHVYVKKQRVPSFICPVFPYGAIESRVQILKNAFFDQFK